LEDKWIPVDALVLRVPVVTAKDIEQFEPKGKLAEEKKLVMGYVVAYDSGIPHVNPLTRTLRQRCHSAIRQELPWQGKEMEDPGI
jgi:Rad4 transglutaminase-like domain